MDFTLSGLVAGISASVLATGWYVVKRKVAVAPSVTACKNFTSQKILQARMSSVIVTDPGLQVLPSAGTSVLDRKTAATRAEQKEKFLKMKIGKDESVSDRDRLSEQLKLTMSEHLDLQAKNSDLLTQLSNQQQEHEREIDDGRNDSQQKISELVRVCDRLEGLMEGVRNKLEQVTASRDQLAAEKDCLTQQVSLFQYNLQAALANTEKVQTTANAYYEQLQNGQLELLRRAARISELEMINIEQMKRIVVLEAEKKLHQSTSAKVLQSGQAQLPGGTKPEKIDAQVFVCTDIRYRNKEIQGYTVVPA